MKTGWNTPQTFFFGDYDDCIKIPRKIFAKMLKLIEEKYGSGGLAFIFHMGSLLGEVAAYKVLTLNDCIHNLVIMIEDYGIGHVVEEKVYNNLVFLKMENCVENGLYDGENLLVFTKGFIMGFLKKFYNKVNIRITKEEYMQGLKVLIDLSH